MNRDRIVAALVTALVVAGTGLANADTAADRCGGAKSKAASKYAKSLFGCYASALRSGDAVDPGCLSASQEKLFSAFDKAEAAGGCVTSDDEAGAQTFVDDARTAVDAILNPGPSEAELTCASAKLKASGRHIQVRLGCYAKGAARSDGPSGQCLGNSYERLASAFAKAESAGGCTTTGDLDAVSDIGDDTVHSLVRALSPVCGDAIQGPTQTCDSNDAPSCPGLCNATCTCDLPPVCGDGVAKLPEECDDGNLADGDGCSSACQLENAGALCTGVTPAAGTDIDAVFISNEFNAPTFATAPRLDPARLFVVEREGYIRILNLADNSVNTTPFLDISDLVTTGGERGCFSMAFDPAYETNGRFYLSCTNLDGDLVLARYEVDSGNPNVADESTRHELLVVPHPGAANHNGGQIQFSTDGYLYWGIGDGGNGDNSQSETSLLGKILRLDVAHDTAPFATVPPTNPNYVDGTSDAEYLWAMGLRNPWRFSFDRLSGDLYIGDVGAGEIEEIDYATSASTGGQNYGWNYFEGSTCQHMSCPDPAGFTFPVFEYHHARPCAVMGGYVYRGCAMPALSGTYFYSDLCAAFVRTFEVSAGVAVNAADRTNDAKSSGASFTGIISWGEDARGELYLINGNNSIYRMEPE